MYRDEHSTGMYKVQGVLSSRWSEDRETEDNNSAALQPTKCMPDNNSAALQPTKCMPDNNSAALQPTKCMPDNNSAALQPTKCMPDNNSAEYFLQINYSHNIQHPKKSHTSIKTLQPPPHLDKPKPGQCSHTHI
ncbi:hypothetical protein Btru_060341 [Bulinus truncatus]|nr:hypothetical protein Btru_060341 [Bulinus truncatus]